MEYTSSILWLASLPVFIFISYRLILFMLRVFDIQENKREIKKLQTKNHMQIN